MGVTISHTYTGSGKYDVGTPVNEEDLGVEKNRAGTSATLDGNSANSNAGNVTEELDLSLDSDNTSNQTDLADNPATVDKNKDIDPTAETSDPKSNVSQNDNSQVSGQATSSEAQISSPTAGNNNNHETDTVGNKLNNNGTDGTTNSNNNQNGNNSEVPSNNLNGDSTNNPAGTDASTPNNISNPSAGNETQLPTSNSPDSSNGQNANLSNNDNGSEQTDISGGNTSSSSSDPKITIKGDVVIIETENEQGEKVVGEMPLDEFKVKLKKSGLTDTDIQRVIDGVIQLVDLYEEISMDDDPSRRRLMLEAAYLNALEFDFSDLDSLLKEIENQQKELEKLISEKNIAYNDEYGFLAYVVSQLQEGHTFDEIYAYQYVDKDGVTKYEYYPPQSLPSDDPNYVEYTPVKFEDVYPNNEEYQKLKEATKIEYTPWFSKTTKVVYQFQYTDEQIEIRDLIFEKAGQEEQARKEAIDPIQSQIDELYEEIQKNQAYYDYIKAEIDYSMEHIDVYTHKEDYLENAFAVPEKYMGVVEQIEDRASGSIWDVNATGSIPILYLRSKEEQVAALAAMINGELNENGIISKGYNIYQLYAGDTIFDHYTQLIQYMTAEEKAIFNYNLNTGGEEAAYNFLEEISIELDNRALNEKRRKDQEYASEHPVLASLYSVFVTPIEGIAAAGASLNSLITGDRIWRIDVYSSGDVMRNQVAADIAVDHPTLSFLYSTGMSMVDSALLIGAGAITGGTALPLISATMMGSRAYVSTLNDALDRGITDGKAVALAFSAAVVETAMESYSASHLLHLDAKMSLGMREITARIANEIKNPKLANIVTQTFNIFGNAVSQGLVEGEEELATEILNYAFDIFIAKDLSNYEKSLEKYAALGYDDSKALQLTMADFSNQAFEAFLGGFISGVCFGSFAGAKENIVTSYGISKGIIAEIQGDTKAQQFANILLQNNQQIEQIGESEKAIFKAQLVDNTNPEIIIKTAKYVASKVLGFNNLNYESIIRALAQGSITTEQASLLLQGTYLNQITSKLKEDLSNYLLKIPQSMQNRIEGRNLVNEAQNPPQLTAATYGDIGTNTNEQIINNTKYALAQLMIRFGESKLQVLYRLATAIREQNYDYFTSRGDSRNIMRQYSWQQINEAYNSIYKEYVETITTDIEKIANSLVERMSPKNPEYNIEDALYTINAYMNGKVGLNYITSLNGARDLIQRYTQQEIKIGLDNYVRILNAMQNLRKVIELYKQKYDDMTYRDIITNIEIYLQTHNLSKITRNGGARSIIANMSDYEISSALSRIMNEYITKTVVIEQTVDVQTDLNEFWNAITQCGRSDYRAINLLYQGIVEQINKGHQFSNELMKQLTALFKVDKSLAIISTTPSDCYWSSHNNNIHLGSLHIEMGDIGTLMHEMGHCLFDKILSENLPINCAKVILEAQQIATNNRQRYEKAIGRIQQIVADEVSKTFFEDLQAKGITYEQYKRQLLAKYSYGNINDILANALRNLGYSDKNIKEVIKNNPTADEAVREEVRAEQRAISDRIWRTKYGSLVAMSDIMDALFLGKKIDNKGRRVLTEYGHGSEYYEKTGKSALYQFHEIIANFTQIMTLGKYEEIQLLAETFGNNFVRMLEETFKTMIGLQNKISQENYNVKEQKKGLFGKIKGIFGVGVNNESINQNMSESNQNISESNNTQINQNEQMNNEAIIEKVTNTTERNATELINSILAKITPDMTQIEIARLLYFELGRKVDYNQYYLYLDRYNAKRENPDADIRAEMNEIYNRQMTFKMLESDRNIICVSWAQLYADLLIKAGFKPENIIIQRALTAADDELAERTHAGIYVKLDDGTIIMPDLTARLGKFDDSYNVKVNNDTTGFIVVTPQQVSEILDFIKNRGEPTNDMLVAVNRLLEVIPEIEKVLHIGNLDINGQNQVLTEDEQTIFKILGHALMSHELIVKKKINSVKVDTIRQEAQTQLYEYLRNANQEYLAETDKSIEHIKQDISEFIGELSDMANEMTVEEVTKQILEDNADINLYFLGLSLYNDKTLLYIKNHLVEQVIRYNLSDQITIGMIGDTRINVMFNKTNAVLPIEVTRNGQVERYVIQQKNNQLTITPMTDTYRMILERLKNTKIPRQERIVLGELDPSWSFEQIQQAVESQNYRIVIDNEQLYLSPIEVAPTIQS